MYTFDAKTLPPRRILPFPSGNHLLVLNGKVVTVVGDEFHLYDVDLSKKTAEDLGEVTAEASKTRLGASLVSRFC